MTRPKSRTGSSGETGQKPRYQRVHGYSPGLLRYLPLLLLTALGAVFLAYSQSSIGLSDSSEPLKDPVPTPEIRNYADRYAIEWGHDPLLASFATPNARAFTPFAYEFQIDEHQVEFTYNDETWDALLEAGLNSNGYSIQSGSIRCNDGNTVMGGCGYFRVGTRSSNPVVQFCVGEDPTCGSGSTQNINHFDGTKNQIDHRYHYGGEIPDNDQDYWLKVHPAFVTGTNTRPTSTTVAWRWYAQVWYMVSEGNFRATLFWNDWNFYIGDETEVGFRGNQPTIEPRKGHLDQFLITWDEPIRYQPDQYGLIPINSSGTVTASRIGANQRFNGAEVVDNINSEYQVDYSNSYLNWPNASPLNQTSSELINGSEIVGSNDRVSINTGERRYTTSVGYYQPVSSCVNARECDGSRQWYNGGGILEFEPNTEMIFRVSAAQYRFNTRLVIYSGISSIFVPSAFSATEAIYTNQGKPGIKLTWEDDYTDSETGTSISGYEYRLGHQEGSDRVWMRDANEELFQFQTTWTTSDWITACPSQITEDPNNTNRKSLVVASPQPNGNGCGGDPNTSIENNKNYRVQVRALDDQRHERLGVTGYLASSLTEYVRNYVNPNLIDVSLDLEPPSAPTNLRTLPTTDQISVTIGSISSGTPLTGTEYRYRRTSDTDSGYTCWVATANPTDTQIQLSGLNPGIDYTIQIRGVNQFGGGAVATTTSTTQSQTGSTQTAAPTPCGTSNTLTTSAGGGGNNPATPTQPSGGGTIPQATPSQPANPNQPAPTGGGGVPNLPILSPSNDGIPAPPETPTEFTDTSSSVHQDNIVQLAAMGVTRGCNPPINDQFCPDRAVSRGEMATFLVRAFDLPPTNSNPFTDTSGNVHRTNINNMAAAGISRGCNPPTNTRFCPDRAVTRGEMATFMTRVLHLRDRGDAEFDDTPGNVHTANIQRFATAGITRGCNPPTNDRFCPDRAVTRGEMATFLVRSTALNSG